MEAATLHSAIDPATGIVNMDIITTGRSAAIKKREEELAERVKAIILANKSVYLTPTAIEKF